MSEVKNKLDLLQWLGPDMSIKVLTHLDDPCDLVRVSTLSRSWHQFVIENGLCKHLCLKMFPELSGVGHVIEVENMIEPVSNMLGSSSNWECLKRNHKVYAFLACGLTPSISKNCISDAISASSTDNYPEESVLNTLDPRDRTDFRASYWSSKGESDPSVPETLVYKLTSKICLITEIHVQPFKAYFQPGLPIYSAKAVRFRMGRPKYPKELESAEVDDIIANHMFGGNLWTYTSPEFPMLQENCLQKFKLPEPILCIGGVLQVELLGRVQKQEMDQLFYIWLIYKSFLSHIHIHMHTGTPRHKQLCIDNSMLFCLKLLKATRDEAFDGSISHVQVVGWPLLPAFDVKIHHPSGKCTLKYCPQTDCCMSPTRRGDSSSPSRLRTFTTSIMQRGVRRWEQILIAALLGPGAVVVDE